MRIQAILGIGRPVTEQGTWLVVGFLVLPCAVLLGAWLDGTLFLPGPGVGLFEHYGFLTYAVSTPILYLLVRLLHGRTLAALSYESGYFDRRALGRSTRRQRTTLLRSLRGAGRGRFVLDLLMLAGLLTTVVNVIQTSSPGAHYGNDTFDSTTHLWGFLAAKAYIGFTWIVVYPAAVFVVVHAGLLLPLLLRSMSRDGALQIEVFHEDQCGGLSGLGTLNFMAMVCYLPPLAFVALRQTHTIVNYATGIVPLFATSAFFVAQSILGVYHLHRAISREKRGVLDRVRERLDDNYARLEAGGEFPAGILLLRDHVATVRTFPYTRNVGALVNVLRFAPSVLGVARILGVGGEG